MPFRGPREHVATAPPRRLDRVLRELDPAASWSTLRRLIESGKLLVDGARVLDPGAIVEPGARIELRMNAPRPERDAALPDTAIVYRDAHVVVVNKPAGVSTVPFEEGERGALSDLVHAWLARHDKRREPPLAVVHRLDRETSGLVLFARTKAAQKALKQQFRFHTTHRRYLAIAHGIVEPRTLSSRLVRDRGDGLRGSTENPKLGRLATTHVTPREPLRGATLVECRLETGRTHQIRIHLAESGHPLVGERVYVREYAGPVLDASRLMLHAAELGFAHPATGRPMSFSVPPPGDFAERLASLKEEGRRAPNIARRPGPGSARSEERAKPQRLGGHSPARSRSRSRSPRSR